MTRDTSAVGALAALSWRGWVVLHELARPGRRRGTLDHVLVGPGGVFVVSRTKWPGPVSVTGGELHWWTPRRRDVTDVAEAAADVLALVPDVPVQPVLCLERHAPVTGWASNVMLSATSNVEEILTSRPPVLGPEQVQQVADVLKTRLRPAPPAAAPSEAPSVRGAMPWPVRVVLQAVTLALAALLVIGLLQTRVVDEISAAVDDFITEVATVEDPPPDRKPAEEQPREKRNGTGPGSGLFLRRTRPAPRPPGSGPGRRRTRGGPPRPVRRRSGPPRRGRRPRRDQPR